MLLRNMYVGISFLILFKNQCEKKFKVFPSHGKRLEIECLGFSWLKLNPNKQQFNYIVRLGKDFKAKPGLEKYLQFLYLQKGNDNVQYGSRLR